MREHIINIVTVLGMLGIPSIFSITIWCFKKCKSFGVQLKILMKSQQAQMRSNLLAQYHQYIEQGYVTEDQLEDWENQYQAYHELGANGVMDARRDQLLQLPSKPN